MDAFRACPEDPPARIRTLPPSVFLPMNSIPRTLPIDLLVRTVQGRNLQGDTLAQNLEPGPTLLVFLRHFG